MAKLPQALDMQRPNGAMSSGQELDFRSLEQAFQNASRQVERYDEARRQADDVEAAQIVEEARQTYAMGAGERVQMYDGRSPGFAEGELKAFDVAFRPLTEREDMSDGVRLAVGRRLRDLRTSAGAQAINVEATARGQRAAADRDASEQATAVRGLMAVQERFDAKEDELRASWDGVSPGYSDALLGAWRAETEAELAKSPEAIQARLRPMLLSQEASLQARSLAVEDERRDADTLRTVRDGLTGLINRAARDPAMLAQFDTQIAPILDAAPAHLRAELRKETLDLAQEKALEARINRGEFEAVGAELDKGAYDAMDPARVARLKDTVKSAQANGVVTDAQEVADFEAAVAADVRNVLKGEAPDADLIRQAQRIGGDSLAVTIRTDQQAAQNVRPLMARLRSMTAVEAEAEIERLTAGATDAVGARTMELGLAMIQQDRRARADPALWAATPVGPGDQAAENVQQRLRAFRTAPSAESAEAYARATWTTQREAGVPLQDRRVLDKATAEAWVAELDAEGTGEAQLAAMAARTGLFGAGFRPQVIRELKLAGMKDADLGALAFYADSPRRLALYARGRGQKLEDLVPQKAEREALDAEIQAALRPFVQALGSRDGSVGALEAARVTAYDMVKRGDAVRDAVRTATAPMTDGYDFQGSWAVPKDRGLTLGRVTLSARREVEALVRRNGAEGYAPPSDRFTPEQARRNYADLVSERAFWRNLLDDSGVELVMPRADGGGVIRVKDGQGEDVVRTWDELERNGRAVSARR
ncbi:hypothetical protein [Brevundimonas sp.]|uniref:hypothetical protein n=1 Tax=Brevundimonas sp. TaxID=1871086 RepID=UPI00289C9DE4|nr:hypothetical protein [Brevundimonas sp.]